MRKFAVLANPGHNRVYFEASKKLSLAEFEICIGNSCSGFKTETIGGVEYFVFSSQQEPPIDIISRLSFAYAVFEVNEINGKVYLLPVPMAENKYFNPNISQILKYTGKTNEVFTRLMINVAAGTYDGEPHTLLDPVCGKGTTLFEGLICGYDVCGIEIGDKVANEACLYFKRYLETERYKHSSSSKRLSGENKSFMSKINYFEFSRNKSDPKKTLTLVSGNAEYANRYFKKNSIDIIVGDLPYGVAHGNVTNEKQSSFTRNPRKLLTGCLPSWCETLKNSGIVVLAWNKFVLPREDFENILADSGFKVFSGGPYDMFEHIVDRSIKRDIIVAKKQ